MKSPRAAPTAALRAMPIPARGSLTTSTGGPKPRAISALRSLEPLSTTISWSQGRVWLSTLSIASAR